MKNKKSTPGLLAWLDKNLLAILAGSLLVFIPLIPKIPLADILPGYIVRIRIEDFFILFTVIVWAIQLVRRKVIWHHTVTKLIAIYLIVGLLSTLSAIFITHTVPFSLIHIGKLYLHYLRRYEYFALFFIFYSAIRTQTQATAIIITQIFVMLGVTIYGYGQKYFYWPVFSTMNREFSKGWKLYLTEHARVPSTFGGHYDAAAYTMVIVIIMLAIFLYAKNRWLKIISGLAFFSGLWLLVLTASRTSFIGYIIGVTLLFILVAMRRSVWYALPRWLGVMLLSLTVMLTFGDLSERYAQLFGLSRFKDKYETLFLAAKIDLPVKKDIGLRPEDLVSSPSDKPPVTEKPGKTLPGDVYEDIPDQQIYFDENGGRVVIETERTYSENAYKYGLSAAIRLDTLWPRAIAGFKSNPLLGSGYSTLTKESVGQFTEAESTDNDYLRSLGETGLLGFLTYFGIIVFLIYMAYRSLNRLENPLFIAVTMGFIAGSIALLINAFYIDVFEASKVAEIYWAMAGLVMVLPLLSKRQHL
jgi:hypothetical protein